MTRQTRQHVGGVSSKALLASMALIKDEKAAIDTLASVRDYLEPVLKAAPSQHGSLTASSQRLAKPYCSFVVHLLQAAMPKIVSEQMPALTTVYVELASLGLESLSVLRGSLKGRPHEVEVQRYILLRKLVSLACYHQAMQQAWLLYDALCCHCWQKDADSFINQGITGQTEPLPKPDTGNIEIGNLVVGTVLNLLLSVVEQGSLQSELCKVMSIVRDYESIMEWLR